MWFQNSKIDSSNSKESLFLSLYEECKFADPGARLSYHLRNRLEKLPKNVRREIASLSKDGCTPLFIACKRGHVEIVEYLITVCDVDIEQRGMYELPDARNDHCVTPLWCAAVSGKLPVTMCLVKYGADVNAVSDTGSTPVRSACFMTHLDIVSYLVENGADIQRGNYNGGTCLINSVQSVQLCLYLLQHGAAVNEKDIQNKTALHYAIQEHRFETTKLLLDHGADPHVRSRYNDDALQTACLKGAVQIFNYLIWRIPYPPERLADAHELLGSTLLDEHNDLQAALSHWKMSTAIRHMSSPPLQKLPVMPPHTGFKFAREFTTEEELRNLAFDLDELRIQSLLICERVLGPHHKNSLFRLMYRGAAYADALRYQRCIDLWRRALEIRVKKDSILFNDTCFTSQALVCLYVGLKCLNTNAAENRGISVHEGPRFEDIAETFKLLADELPASRQLLEIHPVHKKQQETFDRILRCITHLIYLLVETARTEEEKWTVRHLVTKLIQTKPRSAIHGDTLLHLCVSRLNTIKGTYFSDDSQLIFPNLDVIKLLLECGAPVNAINQSHSTPLHIAANTYNFCAPMVELLLENGGHLDQPNYKGECPKSLLMQNQTGLYLIKYVSLKCLAATAVVHYSIPYKGHVPATLETFLAFHQP
ncbi:hypothetical protein RUM43_012855 [Polyplax serrata]|uniref:Uncharacterized protein n=1 Tax=Polyplax serrata TaxID=468196 RepID=A0AAN8NYL4_POLSC